MIISESHLLAELNSLRANPKNYAALLEARTRNYRGKVLYLPNQPPIVTREGVSAVQEALRVLRSTGTLPPLTASRGLSLAARAHVRDIGPKGLVTHQGSDRSTPAQRLRRYAEAFSKTGEAISFGPADARAVVIELVVDDGVPTRGHRKLLLDPEFRLAGAACGPHARYRTMCVIDLAGKS